MFNNVQEIKNLEKKILDSKKINDQLVKEISTYK